MKTFSKKPGAEDSSLVPCPLCAGRDFEKQWKQPNPFVRCSDCGCVYQNPQPVREHLVQRYDHEYLEYELQNEKNFFRLMELGLRDIGFDTIAKEIGTGGAFLDVGCATGMLLEAMRLRGFKVQGVEVCEPAARWGREHRQIDIYPGPVETFSCEPGSFDIAHSSHLIEHLTDPVAYIHKMHTLLKTGGYLIVTTPNIDGAQARLFGYQWRSAIDDHMVLFSKRILVKTLVSQGFSVVKTKTWGGLGAGTCNRVLKALADKAAKRFGFGDVVIILARKHADE
ncbi:MAG: class I SAM-dependent methyltransferase [Spirochaetales bacterium]|nr:class I SAM-dependent methyltransferase [Spirochaetales bacterium]